MDDDAKGATPDEARAVDEEIQGTDEDAVSLLELVLEEARAPDRLAPWSARAEAQPPPRIDGVVIGRLVALDDSGGLLVTFEGVPEGGVAARAMAALGPEDVGRDVALLFEGGDPARPVVMGRMHGGGAHAARTVQADGERLELTAAKEIVLTCGKASITLTKAGKILIRGEYVLSRSSGMHRIQGGSVQIN
jgi:hypothetical protein